MGSGECLHEEKIANGVRNSNFQRPNSKLMAREMLNKGMMNRILLALALLAARAGFGETQPNDNFADRIVLAGNDFAFTGSLSGSTIEPNEPTFGGYLHSGLQ